MSDFGGLEVACWPLVCCGFKSGRSRRIFKGKKKSSARRGAWMFVVIVVCCQVEVSATN